MFWVLVTKTKVGGRQGRRPSLGAGGWHAKLQIFSHHLFKIIEKKSLSVSFKMNAEFTIIQWNEIILFELESHPKFGSQNPKLEIQMSECVCVSDECGGWGRTGKKSGVGRTVPYRKAPLVEGREEVKVWRFSTQHRNKKNVRYRGNAVGWVVSLRTLGRRMCWIWCGKLF